ncbi:LysR family transcriptional regulator, partial [Halomonas icarae]
CSPGAGKKLYRSKSRRTRWGWWTVYVATSGSFTLAAKRLNLSQPAVSDQVKKLEERYNISLLVRSKRQITLSQQGEKLLSITNTIFSATDDAESYLTKSKQLQTGSVSIAADSPIHVMPYIKIFKEKHPNISFSLSSGNSEECIKKVIKHESDFSVTAETNNIIDPRLSTIELSRDKLVVIAPTSHPWSGRKEVELHELSNQPIVIREKGSMTRVVFENTMKEKKLPIFPSIEVEGREAVLEMVLAGLGISVVSEAENKGYKDITSIPIRDCRAKMSEILSWQTSQSEKATTSAFIDCVKNNITL